MMQVSAYPKEFSKHLMLNNGLLVNLRPMQSVLEVARIRQLKSICAYVLFKNFVMLRMLKKQGFRVKEFLEDSDNLEKTLAFNN